MPRDALKMIKNILLYSKTKIAIYDANNDRRAHYTTTTATRGNRTDENLTDIITKFKERLKDEYVYRTCQKVLCDLGLVNQCFKFNTKYIPARETDM